MALFGFGKNQRLKTKKIRMMRFWKLSIQNNKKPLTLCRKVNGFQMEIHLEK